MALADPRVSSGSLATRTGVRLRADYVALLAVVFAFGGECLFFVFNGYLNRDEGWYLLSGKQVFDGGVPYRDFPYFQTPLLPYVFGASQQIFGSGIIAGRATSLIFAAASMALILYIGERIGGRRTAICAAILILLTPDFALASVTARSEAVVVPLTLAALAAMLTYRRGFAAITLAPALLLVATATRLSFLPAVLLCAAFCYGQARPSRREALLAAGALVALAAAFIVPFVIVAPHRTIFDVWTAQAARNNQFGLEQHDVWLTVIRRIWFVNLPFDLFFVVIIPTLFALALIVDRWRSGWRPWRASADDVMSRYLLLIGFAIVLWLPFAGFDHQEDRYFIPSFALSALLAADLFVRASRSYFGEIGRLLPPVFVALVVAHAVFQVGTIREFIDPHDVGQTDGVGAYIASMMSGDDQLVSFNATLAVAADHNVAPQMLMGQFSFWPSMSDADARRNGVVNADVLQDVMLDPRTKVIALDDYDLGLIGNTRPEDDTLPSLTAWPFKLYPQLLSTFDLVRTVTNFGQFDATLYILERRT